VPDDGVGPTCWETSAIVAAERPIAVETNSHDSGNIRETAATASGLTRPTQNMSARLYSVWRRFPTTRGHASRRSRGLIGPVVMSTRLSADTGSGWGSTLVVVPARSGTYSATDGAGPRKRGRGRVPASGVG